MRNKDCFLVSRNLKIHCTALLSLLTVQFREGGAFQDTEVIFDFVGVSAEAIE